MTTPKLTPEHEAEIARVYLGLHEPHGYARGLVPSFNDCDREPCPSNRAMLAELQALQRDNETLRHNAGRFFDEARALREERDALGALVGQLQAERRRDALDGQATLDDANNRIVGLEAERDALDTWGRRLMAVEQERRSGLAGLDDLRRLSAAATPGPWVAVEADEGCALPSGVVVAVHRADEPWKRTGAICDLVGQGDGRYDPSVTTANGRLTAAAVNYVRALLAVDPRPAASPPDRPEGI